MAGLRCTICAHEERVTIDQMLARGTLSLRATADRFGVGRNALTRHYEQHLLKAVQRQIVKRQDREEASTAQVWQERLNSTYAAAHRGVERAEGDPEQWHAGARFLAVAAKLIETGLKAEGVIEGGRTQVQVNTDQVIIMPLPPDRRTNDAVTMDATLAAEDAN